MKTGKRIKMKRTLSIDAETDKRLRVYADIRHSTVSQMVTDWIWQIHLPEEQISQPQEKNLQKRQVYSK